MGVGCLSSLNYYTAVFFFCYFHISFNFVYTFSNLKRWSCGITRAWRSYAPSICTNRPPNIIEMHDWFERRSSFVMVMERPDHCIDLFDYINSKGPLPENTAKIIFKQVVTAVQACHA